MRASEPETPLASQEWEILAGRIWGQMTRRVKLFFDFFAVSNSSVETFFVLSSIPQRSWGDQMNSVLRNAKYLATLPKEPVPVLPVEEKRRGYKVKRNIIQVSPDEMRQREQEAQQVIRENPRFRSDRSRE